MNKKGATEDFVWFYFGVLGLGIPRPYTNTYYSNKEAYEYNVREKYPWESSEVK
jgi:hypothetical protein